MQESDHRSLLIQAGNRRGINHGWKIKFLVTKILKILAPALFAVEIEIEAFNTKTARARAVAMKSRLESELKQLYENAPNKKAPAVDNADCRA